MGFSTAVSGIKASAADLSIIGNNVANSSTIGFKTSRAEFSDVFANSQVGSGANSVGKGVQLSTVNQEFSQGNITFTNNGMDMAINGTGFFILSENGERTYTRAGNFQVDKEGFVINGTGKRLLGQQATATGDLVGQVTDIKIDQSLLQPKNTEEVKLEANFDSRVEPPIVAWGGPFDAFATPSTAPDPNMFNDSTSVTIFDGQGNPHVLSVFYSKSSVPNEWEANTLIDGVTVGTPTTLTFGSNGQFDPASLPVEINITGWTPIDGSGNANGASVQDVLIDLTGTSQLGSEFAVSRVSQDGFTSGQLRGLEVDGDGIVFARYTNGQSRQLARVMLATFGSISGLQPAGDTSWVETSASGPPIVSSSGTSGLGLIQSGALEDSNVDITEQLVRMIVAQRNFQANAQVIQTEDAVTQTVINLR